MIRLRKLSTLWLLMGSSSLMAQQFSLKEAVDYAVTHHVQVKNAQIDVLNADAKINEIKAMGLPQLNGSINLTNNILMRFCCC